MISFMILSLFQSRFLEYNIWFQNTGGTGTPVHQDAGTAVRRNVGTAVRRNTGSGGAALVVAGAGTCADDYSSGMFPGIAVRV